MQGDAASFDVVHVEGQLARALEAARELSDAARILASIASMRALARPGGEAAAVASAETLALAVGALRDLDALLRIFPHGSPWDRALRDVARAAAASAIALEAAAAAFATKGP